MAGFLSLSLLTSCSTVFFGFRNPHKVSDVDIEEDARAWHIPLEDLYVNGSRKLYYCFYLQNKEGYQSLAKNHMQPLQALYFDEKGKMISWHINCLADASLGHINWNNNHVMETFPPGQAAAPDTLLSFPYLQQMLRPLPGTKMDEKTHYDYTVVVYWNAFIRKASKKLIHAVKKNLALAGDARVRVLWVNNENDFAGVGAAFTEEDKRFLDEIFKPR